MQVYVSHRERGKRERSEVECERTPLIDTILIVSVVVFFRKFVPFLLVSSCVAHATSHKAVSWPGFEPLPSLSSSLLHSPFNFLQPVIGVVFVLSVAVPFFSCDGTFFFQDPTTNVVDFEQAKRLRIQERPLLVSKIVTPFPTQL